MWSMIQRIIAPGVLLAAGIVSAMHGMSGHVVEVIQEHEEEVSIPVPTPFGPGPFGPEREPLPGGLAPDGGPPFAEVQPPGPRPMDQPPMDGPPPFWRPPPVFEKVIKITTVTTDEPEPKIIREVSVGGLTLADSGEVKRTYSGQGGPALCPT
jgi:hypothetical protein